MRSVIISLMTLSLLNAFAKLLVFGSVLVGAARLFPSLYPNTRLIMLTMLVLTLVGVVADLIVLPRLYNIPSLLLGILAMTLIIWGCAALWPPSTITLGKALALALLISPFEFLLHKVVLKQLTNLKLLS